MNQVLKLALAVGAVLALACGDTSDIAEGDGEPIKLSSEAGILEAESTADASATEKGIDWGDRGTSALKHCSSLRP